METGSTYDLYLNQLLEITDYLKNENLNQGSATQNERNEALTVDEAYRRSLSELHEARRVAASQYKSVRDSLVSIEGMRLPMDVRPLETDLSWREAIKEQERIAGLIKDWFSVKAQKAREDKQQRIIEDNRRAKAIAESQAEAAAKAKEDAEKEKRKQAEQLVEELKRKFR